MTYTNLPQPLLPTIYDKARDTFLELTTVYSNILAVYEAGTVSQPGISDLDFVLCLTDRLTEPLDIEMAMSAEVRQLIGSGTILKIPASHFTKIKIIDPLPLKYLAGQKYTFTEYDSIWLVLCRIMDWLPERLFIIQKIQRAKTIDVTRTLQILKSVTISLNLCQALVPSSDISSWIQAVQELRANWFVNRDNLSDLVTVLQRGISIIQRAIWQVHDYILEQKYMSQVDQSMSGTQFSIPTGPTFYFDNVRDIKLSNVTLPWSFAYFLAAQVKAIDSWLTQQLSNSFTPDLPETDYYAAITPEWGEVIRERLVYCSEVATYFRHYHLTTGLLKYGWYLN